MIACPVCAAVKATPVLSLPPLPVDLNSQIEPEVASDVTRAPIELVICEACGHLYNGAFDAALVEYDAAYENTLHYSGEFRAHAAELADRLVAEHDLVGGVAVEVGCGPGHFLAMLCERGVGRAIGFDPSFDPSRMETPWHPALTVRAAMLDRAASLHPDLALTQHVLEHLMHPGELLGTFVELLADGGSVYTEVPNGDLMIERTALWDLLYEHVSYFTEASLRTLLSRAGLTASTMGTSFSDQFLWAESSVVKPSDGRPTDAEVAQLVDRSVAFGKAAATAIDQAYEDLARSLERGPVVLWGAGTKGRTYLNLVDGAEDIAAVVDINPRKHGDGIPGTTLTITGPELLASLEPTTVYISNPVYRDEIRAELAEGGVHNAAVVPLWS